MNASRRPRNAHGFRPLAIMLTAAVSGVISAPSASLAALPCVPPTISINDVTITEGNTGTLTAMFTVTQSGQGKASVRYLDRAGYGLESEPTSWRGPGPEIRRRA